jgi:hypothetical protein
MMRAAPLLLAACLIACTHERPISQIHDVTGKWVIVETTNHEKVEAVAIAASDGVTFTNDRVMLGPSEVASVTEVRRGRGALEGAGIGFLTGATIGAVIGFADGDDECDDSGGQWCILVFTATEKAILGGIFIGGIGTIVGVVFGAAMGSKFVYSYGDQVRVTPTGPPGSMGGATITF